jgi:hypothetical protein
MIGDLVPPTAAQLRIKRRVSTTALFSGSNFFKKAAEVT